MSTNPSNIERIIQDYSHMMAERMNEIALNAHSEEDVRHRCNVLIDNFLTTAGINVTARHEYGLKGGRIDSKYGGVIIEYKDPRGAGRITEDRNAAGTKAVIKQIQNRFLDFASEEGIAPERLFGVGADGNTLVFVRYRGSKFEVEDPQPVTPHTVERLLRALVSLGAHGHSFTPENLTTSFGADSLIAQEGISNLYKVITETDNSKAQTFFNQWKILFGEVCGFNVERTNDKLRKLSIHYLVPQARSAELLFSVHTYYAIVIKLLAAEIAASFSPIGASVLKKGVAAPTAAKLRTEMRKLEEGGIWTQMGITNFLEGDLFSWYLAAWDERIAGVIRGILKELDRYDPTTLSVEPAESRDLLKKLYQHLFPKSVRHDLGEYYTPDWLAEHVLNDLEYDGNPDKRLLDPACGSGTFLVMAINRIKSWFVAHRDQCGFGEEELVAKIVRNIIGFDLNPLAVIAARTNYLLAIRDLLKFAPGVELPIYLCDSIMSPTVYGGLTTPRLDQARKLRTSVGEFIIPTEVASDREQLGRYADIIEACIRDSYSADDFLARCTDEGLPVADELLHRELYEQLQALDAKNQNGIWARIIKNAFAPIFTEPVDYIAGNPPWVNWESLPRDYRTDMQPLWQKYGLFSLSRAAGRLGGGKKDLSMLFVYSCVDNYLQEQGRLGFVITQSVFKTKGAGDGFRQFRYDRQYRREEFIKGISDVAKERETIWINPLLVEDMSNFQLFEGATNRTAVFVCQKTKESFTYPVPYIAWYGPSRIQQDDTLEEVQAKTTRLPVVAVPVETGKATSPWLTIPEEALPGVQRILGQSDYVAHAGVYSGGLNGCYWVKVLAKINDGNLLIENLNNVGKIKVEYVQTAIEPDLIYPLLRGRDISRWHAEPSTYIILAQDPTTRTGIPEPEMKRRKLHKTLAYFKRFEPQLRKRASSSIRKLMKDGAFYSMFAVGTYTLAPWKVVWGDMGSEIQVAVIAGKGDKPICPEHHAMFVSLQSSTEAHYICSALMSSPAQLAIAGYTTTTGISSHVLEHVSIPAYSADDPTHNTLALISEQCHAAIATGDEQVVHNLEERLDTVAATLWSISDDELRTIQAALKEIKENSRGSRDMDVEEVEEEAE